MLLHVQNCTLQFGSQKHVALFYLFIHQLHHVQGRWELVHHSFQGMCDRSPILYRTTRATN